MYSGTTMRPLTGRVIGAHQKINRLSRISLDKLIVAGRFPTSKQIMHFEGVNGPDAIKRKSPAKDEPWHYYSPFDEADTQLLDIMSRHYDDLVVALKAKDEVRAAFEAAWLAHAIVDGLTPAHHYPYEEKLAELRGGKGLETRDSLKNKLIMPGENRREMLLNNWKMWGPRGLIKLHGTFEWGVALVLAPLSQKHIALKPTDVAELQEYGMLGLFRRKAKEIHVLRLYEQYQKRGWTPSLAGEIRKKLAPVIVSMVILAWYAAALDAGIAKEQP